jgi:hypothetical protein
MERSKVTPQYLLAKKQQGQKIVRITCYDYPMALLAERAGVDSILVAEHGYMRTKQYDVSYHGGDDLPLQGGNESRPIYPGDS